MTLKQKIIASSTFVAILAALAGIMSYQKSQSVEDSYTEKVEEWYQESMILDDIQAVLTSSQIEMMKGLAPENTAPIAELGNQITHLGALGERQKKVAEELQPSLSRLISLRKSLAYSSEEFSEQNKMALAEVDQIRVEMSHTLQAAKAAGIAACQETGKGIESVYEQILTWVSWASFSIFFCAIILGQIIARDLSKAIDFLKSRAQRLSEGDYTPQKALNRSDEFGKLSLSFNYLAEDLQKSEIIIDQNKQLEELNKRLKNKNDSLDSFVYRVSHDLKAPVINIQSLLRVINDQIAGIDNPVLKKTTFFLGKTTSKLKQTIYDLLEVSRIEDNLKRSKEDNSIKALVDEVLAEKRMSIEEVGVRITQNFEAAPQLYFSRISLKSILVNAIDNAIKYHSSERTPRIDLKTEILEDYVCLSIADNGLGIDLEKQGKKLYGMFNRFHNHVEGSGVGLYIIKKIMDDNRGKVEMLSEVDKGTTVKLYFLMEEMDSKIKNEKTELV